jgi:hypothetical protein
VHPSTRPTRIGSGVRHQQFLDELEEKVPAALGPKSKTSTRNNTPSRSYEVDHIIKERTHASGDYQEFLIAWAAPFHNSRHSWISLDNLSDASGALKLFRDRPRRTAVVRPSVSTVPAPVVHPPVPVRAAVRRAVAPRPIPAAVLAAPATLVASAPIAPVVATAVASPVVLPSAAAAATALELALASAAAAIDLANVPVLAAEQPPITTSILESLNNIPQGHTHLTSLPLTFDTCLTVLLEDLTFIHLTSRPLCKLPPFHRLHDALKRAWYLGLKAFLTWLDTQLDLWVHYHDGLALVNAILDLIALPAHVIIPASNLSPAHGVVTVEAPATSVSPEGSTFQVHLGQRAVPDLPRAPPPPPTISARARTAVHHCKNDHEKLANQTLGSNGVAPRTRATADYATNIHPFYGKDPTLPVAPPSRIEIDEAVSIKSLRSAAGDTQASPDVFGWSPNLLACVAFTKPASNNVRSPIEVLARLKQIITAADVPDAVAVILTSGALNMINKVDEETNERARAEGTKPSYRPVNAGTNLLKQALNDAAHSHSGTKAKCSTLPIQLGLGVKNGPERMAWAIFAAQAEDRAIDSDDAISAFNDLMRQAVLDGVAAGWSEATQLFNKYYGMPSIVFYSYEHEGSRFLRIILGREGVRMGCALGSLGFDLTMHHFVYRQLAAQYKSDEVTLRALTDDLVRLWRTPPTDDQVAWDALYERIAAFKADYDNLANPIGIFRHPGKSALVLPPRAPLPGHHLAGKLTVAPGTTISGRPFAYSSSYVCDRVQARLKIATKRIVDVLSLADFEPAIATKMLITCANKLLDYHVSILPLEISDTITRQFDDTIAKAVVHLLSPSKAIPPDCSKSRTDRAELLMSLNAGDGGFGLTPACIKAPAAVLRSIIAIANEPDLDRSALAAVATAAYNRICAFLSVPNITADHPLGHYLPSDPTDLTSESFAAIFSIKHSRCKLQGLITSAILKGQRNLLRATLASPVLPPGVSTSDAVHILSITQRCVTTRILTASSFHKTNRLGPFHFVAWARFHLSLPQLPVWHDRIQSPLSDCLADSCRANHPANKQWPVDAPPELKILDHNGNHACFCPSQHGARYKTHNQIIFAIIRAARLAGVTANREPSTASLLGHIYTVEQCACLFPYRKQSVADVAVGASTKSLLDLRDHTLDPVERAFIEVALTQLSLTTPTRGKGLRVDVQLVDEDGPANELWLDVSSIHSTAEKYVSKLLRFLKHEQVADTIAVVRKPLRSSIDSSAVAHAAGDKNEKYMPLLQRGRLLHATGKLPQLPEFNPCIVTHAGEFGSGLTRTVEWICTRYRKHVAPKAALMAGTSIVKCTGRFRSETLDSIAAALAKGWAQQLLSVGHPLVLTSPPSLPPSYPPLGVR